MKQLPFRLVAPICLLVLSLPLLSQSKKLVSSDYDRNALTILTLNANETYTGALIQAADTLKVPVKYFDNSLKTKAVPLAADRDAVKKIDPYNLRQPLNLVHGALIDAGIGRQIVARWFDRSDDGSFGVKTLSERGVYNATDNDLLVASASKRGTAGLMDMGMTLVDKSYIIAMDVPELYTMEQKYNRDTVPADKRILNGYEGKITFYVFKLDFSEAVAANFFQNYWLSASSPDKATRKAAFDKAEFPLKHIATLSEVASATQLNPNQKNAPKKQKSQQELLKTFLDMGFNQTLFKLENTNESFRVKAMIASVKPIRVKIGRKEGLKFDQRYFVYENLQDRRGKVYSKRRGVIRSKSVANNLKVADGTSPPSHFYQVAGRKLDDVGMFVEQRNAAGLNVYAGYTDGGLSGGTARLELLLSPLIYEAFSGDGKISNWTGFKLYVEGALGKQEIETLTSFDEYSFMRFNVGLSKEMRISRNIFIEPKMAYGLEYATPPGDNGDQYESGFLEFGLNLGLNLGHAMQLMPSFNYYAVLNSKYLLTKDSEPISIDYQEQFAERLGAGIGIGLRLMF